MGGRGNVPVDAGISVSHKLFAPRVVWPIGLDEKTVVRAGYGLNYDPIPFSRPLRGFYPLTINNNYTALNSFSVANIGTSKLVHAEHSRERHSSSSRARSFDRHRAAGSDRQRAQPLTASSIAAMCSPTTSHWNGKLPEQVVMSAGYVGQHTVHQLADYDINAGFPGSGTHCLPHSQNRANHSNQYVGRLSQRRVQLAAGRL